MDNVRITFILPQNCEDQSQVSSVMIQAYEQCKLHVSNVTWLKETDSEKDFSKTDFVIFQDFEGETFEALKKSKCVSILGPWCVLVCLLEGRPIPNFPWPIYNVAMSNCVVSVSNLPKAVKQQIQEKVQTMGGCYTDDLRCTNTHLITNTVKSEKYLQAAEAGLKLMLRQWVDAVWEASQTANVHANDEQLFINKYRCLPFHNLVVCSTGVQNPEMRNELNKSVVGNGGAFTGSLRLSGTDILVVYGEEGSTSAKYKAARKTQNVHCVTIDWIKDSIAKGYAQPYMNYAVKKSTSTPTKADALDPNFSMMSAIACPSTPAVSCKSTLEETNIQNNGNIHNLHNINAGNTTLIQGGQSNNNNGAGTSSSRVSPNKRKGYYNHNDLIDGLDIKKAKMAGHYLDGCSVYIIGFEGEQREKLCKVLNLSGATRYDSMSDRLTHVIIGDTSCAELRSVLLTNSYDIPFVSVQWLMDSIEKKMLVDEEKYLINLSAIDKHTGSPLGCKGLSLLRTGGIVNDETPEKTLVDVPEHLENEKSIMQHYLPSNSKDTETDTLAQLLKNADNFDSEPHHNYNNLPPESRSGVEKNVSSRDQPSGLTTTITEQYSTEPFDLFRSSKFLLVEFSIDKSSVVKDQIEMSGGIVVSRSYKGIPDYIVSPCFLNAGIKLTATSIVNDLWVSESIEDGEKVEICYYHMPMVVRDDAKPLEGCVVTLSSYTRYERTFLRCLIERLGGVFQEQFSRIPSAEKGVQASSHLVSLEANGKKYAAALKWKLPVVDKDWLLECAKTGKRVSENNFLVGDAQAVVPVVADRTPVRTGKLPNIAAETPGFSQVTPVSKILQEFRQSNRIDPNSPDSPAPRKFPFIATPKTPYGACITPNPSPGLRKEMLNYINAFPDFKPTNPRRLSTAKDATIVVYTWCPYPKIHRRPSKNAEKSCLSDGTLVLGFRPQVETARLRVPPHLPLSELKRRFWERIGTQTNENDCQQVPDVDVERSATFDPEVCAEEIAPRVNLQTKFIDTKLEELENMLATSNNENKRRSSRAFQSTVPGPSSEEVQDSQPLTVGWDYMDQYIPVEKPATTKQRIFIISGVDNDFRQQLVVQLESLGATVSDLATYDPVCTHMVCSKPARNEKTLSCMAAGKWILHVSYVEKSLTAGKFLNEEEFEFGNPKSIKNINIAFDEENELRIQSMHWWRKEIARRGYGAFNDMRAIVVANKREPIVRVIEAGGGVVIEANPPFSSSVPATHCLLEVRSVSDFSVYVPLAKQGIYCLNTLYISDYLFRVSKDIRDCIIPNLAKYYNS